MALMANTEHPLLEQMSAYMNLQEELERTHLGQWVVVANGELMGIFDSYDEAETAAEEQGIDVLHRLICEVGLRSAVTSSW